MVLTATDLTLPLIGQPLPATSPPEERGKTRDDVKLLVIDRLKRRPAHSNFRQLGHWLNPGDLLVVNTSATVPARIRARCDESELILHVATRLSPEAFIVERRTRAGGPDRTVFRPGDQLEILAPGGHTPQTTVTVISKFHERSRLWVVRTTEDLMALAQQIGDPIQYDYVSRKHALSKFETIFAHTPGSAEMPSAGRPFTKSLIRHLAVSGVRFRSVVLHCGVSSHEVEVDLAHHPVLPEWYHVPGATAHEINRTRQQGGRVIAVGTTVVRALESSVNADGLVRPQSGWTTHLVTPDTPPRAVDGLLTGMHENQSSHLALLYAFVPPTLLRDAYQEAIDKGYLWHEFGDVNLIV